MSTYPATPEHDKIAAKRVEHAAVVEFLNWCEENDIVLHKASPEQPSEYRVAWDLVRSTVAIAGYLGVDPVALETEKRAILDYLREAMK